MRNLIFILLVCCAFTTKAQQNLILNGSFEINNPKSTYPCIDFKDGNVQYVTNYGGTVLPFIKDSCLGCSPPVFWGGGAKEGHWFIEMTSLNPKINDGVKIAFHLNTPLLKESNYKLSFSIRKPPFAPLGCTDVKNNYIKVGISNDSTSFGNHIYTSPLGNSIWTKYNVIFNSKNTEKYITVEAGIGDTNNWVVHVDNFVLVETTEQPNAIHKVPQHQKQLLKVVDILGKAAMPKQKGILFYIYSDGTVEKRIILD